MAKKNTSMHVYAIITIVLWSLANVLTRIVVQHFTPEAAAFLRYMVAAVSLLIYGIIIKMRLPAKEDIYGFIFGGAAGFAVYVYAFNTGSQTVTAAVAAFILSATPVITALLAKFILEEKIGIKGWLSVIFAFSGVGVITLYSGGFTFSSGIPWICLSTLLISTYNIFQRKMLTRYSPLEITTYCIISGALMLTIFAPHSIPQLLTADIVQITSIIVLGVFSAGVAYVCWAFALSKAKNTGQVTNYMFLTPIITAFLGFVMINEKPPISAFIGGGLVLLGVALINSGKK